MILTALVAVPLFGALLTLVSPSGSPRRLARLARLHGLVVSGVTLVLALVAAVAFDYGKRGTQLGVDHAWAASIGLRFHLGIDGISLPLIVLTAALTFLCMIYTARVLPGGQGADTPSPQALVGLILLLEVGMLGTFVSLDLVLFFVFFEVVLIPMYFIIANWGGSAASGGVGVVPPQTTRVGRRGRGRRRTSSSCTRCSAPGSCWWASCSSA